MTRRGKERHRPAATTRPATRDGARYGGILLIGVFGVGLVYLATQRGDIARQAAMGFLIAVAFLIHLFGYQAFLGKALQPWQAALARLPLRLVGYGTHRGRPIEAAEGAHEVRTALLVSAAISIVLLGVVGYLLLG